MKNSSFLLLLVLFSLYRCTNKEIYEPKILCQKTDSNNEVRLTLPNGGSKVILEINEPILKSGEKSEFTDDMLVFFDRDSSFKLVHSSYIVIGRNTFYHFFVFKKGNQLIVFKTENDEAGVGKNEVLYEGDIYTTKEDEIKKVENSAINEKQDENKVITYSNDYDAENIIRLEINGDKVELTEYKNGNTINTLNGKYFNNKVYIESEYVSYEFTDNTIRVSDEGYEAKYTKTDEIINDEKKNNLNYNIFSDEKILKFNWGMENKTNFIGDMKSSGPRYASQTFQVPNGKVWIILYFDEHYIYDSGNKFDNVPYLFVNNKKLEWKYRRRFSDKNKINIESAKEEKLGFYKHETLKAISREQNGQGGINFYDYSGELWVLEAPLTDELEKLRTRFELKELKEENIQNQKEMDAIRRSQRSKRWHENAQRKMWTH
jgi:hypothetical protein